MTFVDALPTVTDVDIGFALTTGVAVGVGVFVGVGVSVGVAVASEKQITGNNIKIKINRFIVRPPQILPRFRGR